MITLIIEIVLTIKAWHKGWRGYALLPLAAILAWAFVIGLAVGSAGGTIESVLPGAILGELIGIGVLIRMALKGPRYIAKPAKAPGTVLGLGRSEARLPEPEGTVPAGRLAA